MGSHYVTKNDKSEALHTLTAWSALINRPHHYLIPNHNIWQDAFE
ncbi:30243_t:CDS:2, partial [Racocetra persica]